MIIQYCLIRLYSKSYHMIFFYIIKYHKKYIIWFNTTWYCYIWFFLHDNISNDIVSYDILWYNNISQHLWYCIIRHNKIIFDMVQYHLKLLYHRILDQKIKFHLIQNHILWYNTIIYDIIPKYDTISYCIL